MLSIQGEEVLEFIRDFETSSREYLLSKGLSEYELTNAYLDLQWDFLHAILRQREQKNFTTPFCSQ
ncbi:hypothetical protein [Desulfosporosinus sp. Sb-LF]|uniref:hypothetical protein n=1 Tax=Desulfosporosinus sp. Sb-LF TaxID=2560027 RepID=UPI00107FC16F|nr:hypothetical protein [Desulfosporosinus sp. Sb-LF]TGE32280.1 hypothetical protein E4K68_11770 [Desulfosporosinus sp. Sb-LF]